jgi:peptidoglycan/LPS O-acetylase OafA/YrhL
MAIALQSVQALRGIACLTVVLFHVSSRDLHFFHWVSVHPLRALSHFGYGGVDLFFVLSGFIIASTSRENLGKPGKLVPFLIKRAWRIYPPFWAALALGLGVTAVLNFNYFRADDVGRVLVRTILLVPLPQGFEVLPAAWSLAYEVLFYLAFGLLFLLPRRFGPWTFVAWALAIGLFGLTSDHPATNVFVRHVTSPLVWEFLLGCAVAWLPQRLTGRAAAWTAAAAVVWLGIGLILTPDTSPNGLGIQEFHRAVIFGVGSALFLLAAVGYEQGGGRVRMNWLVRLGDASYSIYLIHGPVQEALFYFDLRYQWPHAWFWHLVWLAAMTVIPVLAAFAFHYAVERPLLAMSRSKKRTTVPRPRPPLIPISLTARHE